MNKRYYYSIKQHLFQLKSKKTNKKVLMFHDINEDINNEFSITLNNFDKMYNRAISKGYDFVAFDDLKENVNNKQIVLTFDDCFDSVYYNVYPYLKEKRVPYYIFICNEYLNKAGYLSDKMIKEMLSDSKCIVGWHFSQHIMVKDISINEFKNKLEEVDVIEEKIGKKISDFAFPYGSMYAVRQEYIMISLKRFKNVALTFACDYNRKYKNMIPRYNVNNKNYNRII